MDMSSMSHSMTMDMASATTSAAMAAATDHDMESMEDMMGGCKISVRVVRLMNYRRPLLISNVQMLWNWNTIDSCEHTQLASLQDPN